MWKYKLKFWWNKILIKLKIKKVPKSRIFIYEKD